MRIDIAKVFILFGVDIRVEMSRCKSFPEAVKMLENCKKKAKVGYKKLAFEHHPDRGGDEDKIKELNALFDLIEKIQVQPPRPRPIVIHFGNFGGWSSSSTTTTSTFTGGGTNIHYTNSGTGTTGGF